MKIGLVFALVLLTSLSAQEVSAPVLSELQRLQIQVLVKDLELAQLRAQMAQRDFEATRTKLTALAARLQVEGYTLDLQAGTYTKGTP